MLVCHEYNLACTADLAPADGRGIRQQRMNFIVRQKSNKLVYTIGAQTQKSDERVFLNKDFMIRYHGSKVNFPQDLK